MLNLMEGLSSGQVCVANKHVAEPGVRAALAAAACHSRRGGGPHKACSCRRGVWGPRLFFNGSQVSSLPGWTEAAVTHVHDNMYVFGYPNLFKAVPNLSTTFDYQLDLFTAQQ